MRKRAPFSVIYTTKGKLPRLPLLRIKDAVLGKHYELSLASVNSKTSQRLNKTHRGKDKPTNVLSFPLSKNSGEIIFDLRQAAKDAPSFGVDPRAFIARLFIHACLHLKGFSHGGTMERKERDYCARFGFRM